MPDGWYDDDTNVHENSNGNSNDLQRPRKDEYQHPWQRQVATQPAHFAEPPPDSPGRGVKKEVVQVTVPYPQDIGAGVQRRQRPREPSPAELGVGGGGTSTNNE